MKRLIILLLLLPLFGIAQNYEQNSDSIVNAIMDKETPMIKSLPMNGGGMYYLQYPSARITIYWFDEIPYQEPERIYYDCVLKNGEIVFRMGFNINDYFSVSNRTLKRIRNIVGKE